MSSLKTSDNNEALAMAIVAAILAHRDFSETIQIKHFYEAQEYIAEAKGVVAELIKGEKNRVSRQASVREALRKIRKEKENK